MANTYDADLVIDRLAESAILVLQKKLPQLNAFSQDFGADVLKPRATVQVEKSGTGATAQSNPTNYETGNVTNSNVAVSVAEKTVSWSIASQEMMSGHKLDTKAAQQLRGLANAVWAVPEALLDESVYTNTVVVATEAAIDAALTRRTRTHSTTNPALTISTRLIIAASGAMPRTPTLADSSAGRTPWPLLPESHSLTQSWPTKWKPPASWKSLISA